MEKQPVGKSDSPLGRRSSIPRLPGPSVSMRLRLRGCETACLAAPLPLWARRWRQWLQRVLGSLGGGSHSKMDKWISQVEFPGGATPRRSLKRMMGNLKPRVRVAKKQLRRKGSHLKRKAKGYPKRLQEKKRRRKLVPAKMVKTPTLQLCGPKCSADDLKMEMSVFLHRC